MGVGFELLWSVVVLFLHGVWRLVKEVEEGQLVWVVGCSVCVLGFGLLLVSTGLRDFLWEWIVLVVLDALPPCDFCPAAARRVVKAWMKSQGWRVKNKVQRRAAGWRKPDYQLQPSRPYHVCRRVPALVLLCTLLCTVSSTVAVTSSDFFAQSDVLLQCALGNRAAVACIGAVQPFVGLHQPFLSSPYSYLNNPAVAAVLESVTPGSEPTLVKEESYTKDPEGLWTWGNHPNMTAEAAEQLQEAVRMRKHCFAYSLTDLPGYSGTVPPFRIVLKHDNPIRSKQRTYSVMEQSIRQEKLGEMRDAHMLEPSPPNTQYASCLHFPAKRDVNGNWSDKRVTTDFRAINRDTVTDQYMLHRADDLFDKVSKAKFFTKIDLRSGFHQIPVHPDDRPKTAFWWGNELWQYTRLPMGLKNSPAHFQRIMDHEVQEAGLVGNVVCFLDDLLIYSDTVEEHITHVSCMLDRLHEVGLRAHPGKSVFGAAVIEFLGHNVSHTGIHPTSAKVLAISELRTPTCVHDLQSVLGLMNYYRRFVPNYSTLQQPLNGLLKKGAQWEWTSEHDQAYKSLKEALCKPGNALKSFDPSLPTKLYTDWSKKGIGAVLCQVHEDGHEYLVACISRSLNKAEQNYSSYEGEMLAATWAIKTFRMYLHGIQFTVITDHQPLLWLMSSVELTGKHARWALMLQDYDFKVEHRPGLKHQNADVPSRYPLANTDDPTGARLDHDPVPSSAIASFSACFASMGGSISNTVVAFLSALRINLLDGLDAAAPGEGFIDDFAPNADQLLDGYARKLSRHAEPEPTATYPAGQQEQMELHHRAREWVMASREALSVTGPHPPQQLTHLPFSDQYHVHPTTGIDTSLVPNQFFTAAEGEGIVLVELFGGLCAGLHMCLANQVKIKSYLYCDIDPAAHTVARMQVAKALGQYPDLLPFTAVKNTFTALPQDVRQISTEILVEAGALAGDQWFVVAGWECQDLSPAGKGKGLDGPRSSTFFDVVRIIGALQQLQPCRPPAYLLENSPLQHNWRSPRVRNQDYPRVLAAVGNPITFDAAQFNSFAHRVRNYWTNLCDANQFGTVLHAVTRDETLTVDQILDPTRTAQVARSPDFEPAYRCNRVGKPLAALPTLVSYPSSRAFRDGKSGMVWDASKGRLEEPNPDERERALGYVTGTTDHPDLTPDIRHTITGRCMDRNAVVNLFAISRALHDCRITPSSHSLVQPCDICTASRTSGTPPGPHSHSHVTSTAPSHPTSSASSLQASTAGTNGPVLPCHDTDHAQDVHNCLASELVNAQETHVNLSSRDPWLDAPLVHYLQTGETAPEEAKRVKQRAQYYRFLDGNLQRLVSTGRWCTVPPPEVRPELIMFVHTAYGHFGQKRTKSQLLLDWWWPGLEDDVVRVLSTCPHCRQVNTSFGTPPNTLHTLPIKGFMYRWSCDLAGPLPTTVHNNTYLFIAIEHFTKTIVVAAIPEKSAVHTATAFLSHVIGRFGACAEVVTDQGGEWLGQFHELCESCKIDHRTTSAYHPQANGMTERAVQTIKRSIGKFCAQATTPEVWDLHMHYIALGYNCSTQASTNCSPYQLLYGAAPTLPPAIKERFQEHISLDPLGPQTPEEAAEYLLDRADLLHQNMVMAWDNLSIAQHRDQLRYAQKRSGLWKPTQVHTFNVGDFVYVLRPTRVSKLQPLAGDGIYRIVEMRDSGAVVLQGRCGRRTPVHVENIAPCHLSNLDPTVNPALALIDEDHPCAVCGNTDREDVMLLCDYCNHGYHMDCLQPALTTTPKGIWLCPTCVHFNITTADVKRLNAPTTKPTDTVIFKSKAQRLRDARARSLVGQFVKWSPKNHAWGPGPFIGQLEYVLDRGRKPRPLVGIFAQGRGPAWDVATAEKLLIAEDSADRALVSFAEAHDRNIHPLQSLLEWLPISPTLPGYHQDLQELEQRYGQRPGQLSFTVPDTAAQELQQALQPGGFLRGIDGWGSQGEHPLGGTAWEFRVNSLGAGTHYTLHPLHIRSHAHMAQEYAPDLHVCFVPELALDAYLPLAYAFTQSLVCALVPVTYFTVTHTGRSGWLEQLHSSSLVRFVHIPADSSHVWLLLSRTTGVWNRLHCITAASSHLPLLPGSAA